MVPGDTGPTRQGLVPVTWCCGQHCTSLWARDPGATPCARQGRRLSPYAHGLACRSHTHKPEHPQATRAPCKLQAWGRTQETKGCRPLHTAAQVTASLARGPVAWPALDGPAVPLAGLGPRSHRWRGHDYPLAEVAPGGPFIPGAGEVTLHRAATVRACKATVKRVHVQANWG